MTKAFSFPFWLLAAFASVVLAFTGSTAYVHVQSLDIDAEVHALSDNALPSIARLGAAANAIHAIETAADAYAELPAERATARETIAGRWREVDRDLATYRELPSYPGERERYESGSPASLRALDAAVARLFAVVDDVHAAPSREAALRDVRRSSVQAADLLTDLMVFNGDHARAHADHIEAARRRTSSIALGLDSVALVVGLVAALGMLRLFRAGARLQAAHGALVEERAAELEVFATRVAHDLLSPLSALTFCLGAFKRASQGDPKLGEALARARGCVVRAQRMVESIFEFARAGGRPAPDGRADVREVAEQVAAELRAAELRERPEVVIEPFPPCAVACTGGVLSSMLANLMGNAAKYLSDSAVRRITVRAAEAGNTVRIEVEDTGPGVPAGLAEAIFEPYVRAAGATQAGLGLGLATVRRLCTAHGGAAGVHSVAGRGSTFWITLPKAAPALANEAPSGPEPPLEPPPGRPVVRLVR